MPCCGQQKSENRSRAQAQPGHKSAATVARPKYRYAVYFEYVGPTALTVIGSATNKKYRFGRPGSRVEIDPRDRPSISKVPNLREVTTLDGI
jgi:hypothetical protein